MISSRYMRYSESVDAENFESIHNHSAYAFIEAYKEDLAETADDLGGK